MLCYLKGGEKKGKREKKGRKRKMRSEKGKIYAKGSEKGNSGVHLAYRGKRKCSFTEWEGEMHMVR